MKNLDDLSDDEIVELYSWKDRQRAERKAARDRGDLEDGARIVEAIIVSVCLICWTALIIWGIASST